MEININEISGDKSVEELKKIIFDLKEIGFSLNITEREKLLIKIYNKIERELSEEVKKEILLYQGEFCFDEHLGKYLEPIIHNSKNLDNYIALLNKNIFKKETITKLGDFYYLTFEKCFCKDIENIINRISPTYCYCSLGWVKKLFEVYLRRDVKCKIVGTVVRGKKNCEFKIFIED